jgi:aryl-alcohol dehydrogenase-like predicted oxidoreductase
VGRGSEMEGSVRWFVAGLDLGDLASGFQVLVELPRGIGKKHGVEPGVVAVAWTPHNPAVTAAIVGGRSGKQVEGTLTTNSRATA